MRKGGKFAVSDIVVRNLLPLNVNKSMEMRIDGVAGGLLEKECIAKVKKLDFPSRI